MGGKVTFIRPLNISSVPMFMQYKRSSLGRENNDLTARGDLGAAPQPHLDLHASADFLSVRKDRHHAQALKERGLACLLVAHLVRGQSKLTGHFLQDALLFINELRRGSQADGSPNENKRLARE
jgi:hypothetical protein